MSKRVLTIICAIEAIIIILLLVDLPKTPVRSASDVIIKEIVKDSIIRDSIFIVNEKIKREIVYIEKQAQQDSIDIISANDSVLYSKFSRYINNYNNK